MKEYIFARPNEMTLKEAVYDANFRGELIRCKDCKHRPTIDREYEDGFDINFPDMICPCQCEDGWYNWMPEDDWYCANGERKEE